MTKEKEYYAFISYKREDEKWAKWLQDKLEHYRFPTNLNGRTDLPKHIRPTFRDVTDLNPGLLAEEINYALRNSEWLIVVCSTRSAKSPWVCKETQTFIDLGRADHIIPFVIEGNPFSTDTATECYPEALLNLTGSKELLAANINEMGRDAAAIKVVARMFNLRFDALWQRYEREKKRKRNWMIIAAIVAFMCISGVAFWMYWQEQQTQKANWKMMENQARAVAGKAHEEIKKGNTYEAILALLEVVPENNRPYVAEVEAALREGCDSLYFGKWNYRRSEYDGFLTDDEQYIIGSNDDKVTIINAYSLGLVSMIDVPHDAGDVELFISDNNDIIYAVDSVKVRCYKVPSGKYIKDVLLQDVLKEQDFIKQLNKCNNNMIANDISFWRKSVGLSLKTEIIKYCMTKNIALIKKLISHTDEYDNPYVLSIYDCNSKKEILTIDNEGRAFDETMDYVCNSSFSADGNRLLLSYSFGGGVIINTDDNSKQLINCGNGYCNHYSNWYRYTNSGQILHSSRFENSLKIMDGKSLLVIDSIIPPNGEEIWSAHLNDSGDKCWIRSGNDLYLFYKCQNTRQQRVSLNDCIKFDRSIFKEDTIVDGRYYIRIVGKKLIFEDKKGIYKDWQHEGDYGCNVFGIINGKYLIVNNEQRFFSDYSIIEMRSGVEICRFQNAGDLYYDLKMERFLINGYVYGDTYTTDIPYVYDFPSYEKVVTKCREITRGMFLSESSKRFYYL